MHARGSSLEGTPSGAVKKVDSMDAYLMSGVTVFEPVTPETSGTVLLTDVFGLELVNRKLIADKVAALLACGSLIYLMVVSS